MPSIWPTLNDLEQAKRYIDEGDRPFKPEENLDKLPLRDCWCILDFGCGIGRNTERLLELSKGNIIGYDYPNMISLARKYLGPEKWRRITWLSPPLSNLKGFVFDFVIACLVFQHIPERELREILITLNAQMPPSGRLWVASRSYSDDSFKSVWDMILDYFQPISPFDREAAWGENHQQVLFQKLTLQ